MPDVFISYSRRDSEFVRKVVDNLIEHKRDVWVDWEDIPLTADWWQEIQDGIDESSAFVFIISPDSVQSEVCRQELDHAINNNKRFIPVLYREIETPEDKAAMHPKISSHNWLFFRETDDFNKAVNALNDAIDLDLDHSRNHTRLLVRAKEWNTKGKNNSSLLTGSEISEAEQWLATALEKQPKPLEIHSEYIFASRAAANKRQRNLLTGVTVALVVSVLLGIAAVIGFTQASAARDEAEIARDEAERERDIATSLNYSTSAQLAMSEADNDLAILLGLQATEIENPPSQSRQVLEEAAFSPGTREIYAVHEVEGNTIYSIQPASDDNLMLSADRSGRIILWQLDTGEIVREMNEEGRVRNAIFSPDESQVLSSSDDMNIRLWDANSGEPIRTFTDEENGHQVRARALAFIDDGESVIVGDDNGVLIRWDVATGEIIQRYTDEENGNDNLIWDIAIMPNGETFIAVDNDGRIVEWNLESGEFVRSLDAHTSGVLSVDVNADGSQIITSSTDRTVRLWDYETGTVIHTMQGHGAAITGVEFSPVGPYAASGANDNSVIVWNIDDGSEVYRFAGTEGFINAVAYLSDGRSLLSISGFDAVTRLWDVVEGANNNRYFGHTATVGDVLITDDGTQLISAAGEVIQWDAATGEALFTYGENSGDAGHTERILEMAFGANQEILATGSQDQTIILWNTGDGSIIRTLSGEHEDAISALVFNPDGTILATGDAAEEPRIILWDVASGEVIGSVDDIGSRVFDVAISPDGTLLVAALENGEISVRSIETQEELQRLAEHSGPAIDVDFSPDGSQLASVSQDTTVLVWNVADWSVTTRISAYTQPLNSVDFHPDGEMIVVGGDDGTIRLWDAATGEELRRVVTQNGGVERVKFHIDGEFIATAHEDGTVQTWALPPLSLDELKAWALDNRNVQTFTQEECDRFGIDPCDLPAVAQTGT